MRIYNQQFVYNKIKRFQITLFDLFLPLIENYSIQLTANRNHQMSVYSGFATRGQQNKYNFLLETLLVALKKRLIKFYKQQDCDQNKFKLLIKKIYKKMFLLEKGKFITPKYTSCFTDLIETMNIQINYQSLSDASSMMSQTFSLRKQKQNNSNQNTPNDMEDQNLKSRNILQSKRNLLQSHKNNMSTLNLSAFSLKKPYFNTLNVDTLQTDKSLDKINRSASLGLQQTPLNALKQKIKLRKLQDLKNLRGTIHMPKVEDFLPKRQQIQTSLFKRANMLQPPKQHRGGYRRQKYSRAQINVEDI